MPTKVLVTHREAIQQKYRANWAELDIAIQKLIAADALRGITTTLVYLDDQSLGAARAVRADARSFKSAIDYVATRAPKPDYIAILGGPDIVPHQLLKNPVVQDDRDRDVPSDLPYASDAPWGEDVESFVAPARVVGRIPDQPDEIRPDGLIRILDHAARWRPPTQAPQDYFCVTAHVWIGCARITLEKLFGNSSALRISPSDGPGWSAADLAPRWHFIVCHGSHASSDFYGEKDREFPVSHRSQTVLERSAVGTVVSAECCYGAELYSTRLASLPGICLSYLRAGAIAFMGSTNIAYGGRDDISGCDYLCRYFLEHVRKGASLGRALLEARLEFARGVNALSPVDLKTLAQFLLLGDPSLRAVAPTPFETFTHSRAVVRAHNARRELLSGEAEALARGTPRAIRATAAYSSGDVRARLEAEAAAAGYTATGLPRSYDAHVPAPFAAGAAVSPVMRFHVMAARPAGEASLTRSVDPASPASEVTVSLLVVARERDGAIAGIERLYAREGAGQPRVYEGRVIRKLVAKGSRSEHDAVMLEMAEGEVVLRRRDANAFSDPVLDELVGKSIRGTGDLTGQTLLLRDWTVIA